jgi:hypothetical protein
MPRSATLRARDLAVPRNYASLRFIATRMGTGFAGGLLRCAPCEGRGRDTLLMKLLLIRPDEV